jgi:hypothetical protein
MTSLITESELEAIKAESIGWQPLGDAYLHMIEPLRLVIVTAWQQSRNKLKTQ